MLSPPPLRTARESFDSSRSSLSNALLGTRLRHSSALPSRYASGADEHCGELAASRWSADSLSCQRLHQRSFSVVICFSSLAGLPDSLVRKDQKEVCPLSRGVMLPKIPLANSPLIPKSVISCCRRKIKPMPHTIWSLINVT